MNSIVDRFVVFTLVTIGASAAAVAGSPISSAAARFEVDRAMCLRGQTGQSHTDCLREAAAAHAQAKREVANEDETQFEKNRIQRCEALPTRDRRDCLARMQGQGTTSGSVEGGGIYRELVTTERDDASN